eukprot:s2025_g10.t1
MFAPAPAGVSSRCGVHVLRTPGFSHSGVRKRIGSSSGVWLCAEAAGIACVQRLCATRVCRRAAKEDSPTEVDSKAAPPALSEEAQETLAKAKARSKARKTERTPAFDPSAEVGVTAPLGFFDPAGFCKDVDKIKFRQLRTSELKHGRIAMLAAIGLVGQHYLRFPFAVFDELPNGIGAVTEDDQHVVLDTETGQISRPGQLGIFTLFGVALLPEFSTPDASREVGDFGDPLGFQQLTFGADLRELRNRELNNGRFAMFATMGIIAAELVTGKDAVEQLGLN